MRNLLQKIKAYATVLPKAKRNRTDLTRHLVKRPFIGAAVAAYETAVFLSSSVDNRTKTLASIRASALIGCPF